MKQRHVLLWGWLWIVLTLPHAVMAKDLLHNLRPDHRPWNILSNTLATAQLPLRAVKTRQPPVIDGRLNEPQWEKAFTVKAFSKMRYEGYATHGNQVKILYDDQAIYVACIGQIQAWTEHLAKARKKDDNVWKDEGFEIFIDPGRSQDVYYHFITNAVGSVQDGKGWSKRYNAEWRAATSHSAQSWSLEVAIPYAALEAKAPRVGEVWGMNVARNDKALNEPSSLISMPVSFHDAKKFAPLQFGKAPPAYLDDFAFDNVALGSNILKFKVSGQNVGALKIRGQLQTRDGKPIGSPTEVTASTNGYTKLPYTLSETGEFHLQVDVLKGSAVVVTYGFTVAIYEHRLVILVPGSTHFYQGQSHLPLRFDIRLKEKMLPLYRLKVVLKHNQKLLAQQWVDQLEAVYIRSDMAISDLPLGQYTIEATMFDRSNQDVGTSRSTFEIIHGPFAKP